MMFSALLLLPLGWTAPAPEQDTVRYARISAESAPLHAHYDAKTAQVGKFPKGMPLRVVGEMQPWLRVEVPGGLDLWIHGDYALEDDGQWRPTNDRVRARPLPATDSTSHPLGHYSVRDRMTLVGSDGDWLQVRAPERLSAWVAADAVRIQSVKPEGWDADWKEWAGNNAPTPAPAPGGEEPPADSGEVPVPAPVPAPVGGEVDVPDAATEVVADAQPAEASARKPLPQPAELAADPEAGMTRIETDLEDLYQKMVADREHWDRPRLDALEFAIGHLLWNAQPEEMVDRGRAALRRVDVLRRAYLDALGRQVRAAEKRGDSEVAVLLRRRLETAEAPLPEAEAGDVVVGNVVYEPKPLSGRPYRVERLGFDATVHSFDGRYSLADYRGREVVLLGTWRSEASEEPGEMRRVFDIRQVRVLPRLRGE